MNELSSSSFVSVDVAFLILVQILIASIAFSMFCSIVCFRYCLSSRSSYSFFRTLSFVEMNFSWLLVRTFSIPVTNSFISLIRWFCSFLLFDSTSAFEFSSFSSFFIEFSFLELSLFTKTNNFFQNTNTYCNKLIYSSSEITLSSKSLYFAFNCKISSSQDFFSL